MLRQTSVLILALEATTQDWSCQNFTPTVWSISAVTAAFIASTRGARYT